MEFETFTACILLLAIGVSLMQLCSLEGKKEAEKPATLLQRRVACGAAWLDRRMPGWEAKIDLETLNIASNECCVLGQLFGSFNHCHEIKGRAVELGMQQSVGLDVAGYYTLENYRALTEAWKREIETRLAA